LFKIDRAPKVRYLSLEEETRLRQVLFERECQLKQERVSANQWRKERGYALFPEFTEEEFCDYLMPMVLLSINTGLRQGELFNLTWGMVEISERSIIISGEITKNGSFRYIPLNDEAFKIIKPLYEKSAFKGVAAPSVSEFTVWHLSLL
jgi:integrase